MDLKSKSPFEKVPDAETEVICDKTGDGVTTKCWFSAPSKFRECDEEGLDSSNGVDIAEERGWVLYSSLSKDSIDSWESNRCRWVVTRGDWYRIWSGISGLCAKLARVPMRFISSANVVFEVSVLQSKQMGKDSSASSLEQWCWLFEKRAFWGGDWDSMWRLSGDCGKLGVDDILMAYASCRRRWAISVLEASKSRPREFAVDSKQVFFVVRDWRRILSSGMLSAFIVRSRQSESIESIEWAGSNAGFSTESRSKASYWRVNCWSMRSVLCQRASTFFLSQLTWEFSWSKDSLASSRSDIWYSSASERALKCRILAIFSCSSFKVWVSSETFDSAAANESETCSRSLTSSEFSK